MGYTYSFMDNAVYGADDINGIIKTISTQGISVEFEDILNDGVSYTPSDLNQLLQAIASEGVTKDSCLVMQSGDNVKVTAGTIIFANGSTLTVDSEGVTLAVQSGAVNYIYAVSDMALNKNEIKCETAAPTGDYVMLAEWSDGVFTDKRQFATSKFATGYNMHEVFRTQKKYRIETDSEFVLVDTFPLRRSDYTRLILINHNVDSSSQTEHFVFAANVWDLTTGAIMGYDFSSRGTDEISNCARISYSSPIEYVKFVIEGLNLQMYIKGTISYTADFTIELC